MGHFVQDPIYGTRMLLRDPRFSLVALLTLALGIGANTAILSAVTLLLTLVALAACWLPARRAIRVDPMIALRCE